jgi:phage terminase small subunit
MSEGKKLNPREQCFVNEYLVDLNVTQASIRAGYKPRSAAVRGSVLLKKVHVKEAVRKAMAERAERTQITADRVLREYARIAFADIRKYTRRTRRGLKLRPVERLSDDDAAAVAEIAGGSRKTGPRVKLHDKKGALDAIARHLGLFGVRRASGESPAEAADRARELILSRLARLARPEEPE